MKSKETLTVTVVALDDAAGDIAGFHYIARFQPRLEPEFFFAAGGQFDIWSTLSNCKIDIHWLPIETALRSKAVWKGPIDVDQEQILILKNAVLELDQHRVEKNNKSTSLLGD